MHKTDINGLFSIAMLVYWRVCDFFRALICQLWSNIETQLLNPSDITRSNEFPIITAGTRTCRTAHLQVHLLHLKLQRDYPHIQPSKEWKRSHWMIWPESFWILWDILNLRLHNPNHSWFCRGLSLSFYTSISLHTYEIISYIGWMCFCGYRLYRLIKNMFGST